MSSLIPYTYAPAAYGWEWPLSDEQILERLLKLNHERAAAEDLAEPEREPA